MLNFFLLHILKYVFRSFYYSYIYLVLNNDENVFCQETKHKENFPMLNLKTLAPQFK